MFLLWYRSVAAGSGVCTYVLCTVAGSWVAMLQILIFSFCEESWNASLAKVMHMASHSPAAKEISLQVGEGGVLSESVKKGKFVTKIFFSVNAE